MRRTLILCFAGAAILVASGSPGIRPRASAEDYPVHRSAPSATLGAAIIPPSEAKKIFGMDLNSAGYVVIEVGVFPAPGRTSLDLSPSDFTLETDPDSVAERPVDDEAVAAAIDSKRNPPRTSSGTGDIYPSVGATVGHGTWTDPTTGRRTSGTVTGVSTGVGVGAPPPMACPAGYCDDRYPAPLPPQATGANRGQIEQQLWEKSLPDGNINRPVAGYLYFPKPSGKARGKTKPNVWVLRWDNEGARMKLELPRAK